MIATFGDSGAVSFTFGGGGGVSFLLAFSIVLPLFLAALAFVLIGRTYRWFKKA